jgi:hypothetical protein
MNVFTKKIMRIAHVFRAWHCDAPQICAYIYSARKEGGKVALRGEGREGGSEQGGQSGKKELQRSDRQQSCSFRPG